MGERLDNVDPLSLLCNFWYAVPPENNRWDSMVESGTALLSRVVRASRIDLCGAKRRCPYYPPCEPLAAAIIAGDESGKTCESAENTLLQTLSQDLRQRYVWTERICRLFFKKRDRPRSYRNRFVLMVLEKAIGSTRSRSGKQSETDSSQSREQSIHRLLLSHPVKLWTLRASPMLTTTWRRSRKSESYASRSGLKKPLKPPRRPS